jgi:hypothetical protein
MLYARVYAYMHACVGVLDWHRAALADSLYDLRYRLIALADSQSMHRVALFVVTVSCVLSHSLWS